MVIVIRIHHEVFPDFVEILFRDVGREIIIKRDISGKRVFE